LWPFFIIGFGILFFAGMLAAGRGSDAGALAIPGSLFVVLGLIFLYQSIFSHWASWAYIWSLLAPTSIGIGLIIYAWWSRRPQLRQPGIVLVTIGLCIFVILGGFFELMIGFAGIQTPGRVLWPIMLILFGIFLLVGRSFRWLSIPHSDSMPAAVSVDVTPPSETPKQSNTEASSPS
jgi:hypothetical protein